MAKLRVIMLGLLISSVLTACASYKAKTGTANAKTDKDAEEYVDYYPIGSHVPVRVPKSQVRKSDKDTTDSQDVLREMQRMGSRAVSQSNLKNK